MITPSAILEVKDLTKIYDPEIHAVKAMSFSINKGEVFGIPGPNGAGKTATLEMIEGLRWISSGTVILDGINTREHPYLIKKESGFNFNRLPFSKILNSPNGLKC
jgi:ABC-2 type transport system ATP-binding protein